MNFPNLQWSFEEAVSACEDLAAFDASGIWNPVPEWVIFLGEQLRTGNGNSHIQLMAWKEIARVFAKELKV